MGIKHETRIYYDAKITNRFSTHNNYCVIKTIAYMRIVGIEVHHRGLRQNSLKLPHVTPMLQLTLYIVYI